MFVASYIQGLATKENLALAGVIIGILLSLSPIPTFIDIAIHSKTTGGYTVAPYISSILCCSLWLTYALVAGSSKYDLVPLNVLSFVIYSVYCGIFAFYSPQRLKVIQIYLTGLGALAVAVIVGVVTRSLAFLGVVATVSNCLMFAAPLAVMQSVIETKSVRYMPFLLSFTSFLCASVWMAWALVVSDYFVLIPNSLGVVLGLVQLGLYSMYCRANLQLEDHIGLRSDEAEGTPMSKLVNPTADTSTVHHVRELAE